MGAKALESLDLFFGLAAIPVRVFSATKDPPSVSFNLLHARCSSRVKQQYVCTTDNALVERDELVKGYEVAKDRYVVFTTPELEALEAPPAPGIHIMEWLELERVDPVFFAKPYLLGPDKGAERPYLLLLEVMARLQKVALARYSGRQKERLVLLRPGVGGRLVMQQLLHAEEVRDPGDVDVPAAELDPLELELAEKLAEQTSVDTFRPEAHPDEQRQRVLTLIREKVEGREIVAPPEVKGRRQFVNLADALRASLTPRAAAAPRRATRAKPRTRAAR